MTKTKTKTDYTSLSRERNYWFQAILLCLLVGVAYFGNIYRTNNNSDGINAVVITAPSIAATTTASLIRGGDGDGDAGREDLSSTSAGDNSIESNTNTFVEEGGGRHYDKICASPDPCSKHTGTNEKACTGQGGCFWYAHTGGVPGYIGYCSSCPGVSCSGRRADGCGHCLEYEGDWLGKAGCNGDCKWVDSRNYCFPK